MFCFIVSSISITTTFPVTGVPPTGKSEQKGKRSEQNGCADPAGAFMDVLDCFENKDAACAAAAYTPGFQFKHNEVPVVRDDQGIDTLD